MSRPISISELAELTGKDRRDVRAALDGLDYKLGPKNSKEYNSKDALARLYLKTNLSTVEEQRAEAQLEVEKLRGKKLLQDILEREGQLVPIEDVAGVVENEYAAVRAGLFALGARLARDLVAIDNAIEIKNRIDSEVNSILSELSADETKGESN